MTSMARAGAIIRWALLGAGGIGCAVSGPTPDPSDSETTPAMTTGGAGGGSDELPTGGTRSDGSGGVSAGGGEQGTGGATTDDPPPLTTPGDGRFEPPDGRTLLIIGQNKQPMQEYVQDIGLPAGFMTYTTISSLGGFDEPPERMDFHYWPDTYDNIVMQVALALNDTETISATLAGTYDSQLDSLANHFKSVNVPVYLRVGYEVQGKFDATGYPEVFRYIRAYLEGQGVENVAYVWHVTPGYTKNGVDNHFDWYPGDDVVDWIAISFFLDVVGRYAPNDSSQSGVLDAETFERVENNLETISVYARARGIPLMVAEAAPQKNFEPALGESVWADWYEPLFEYVEKYDVKAVSYINQRWEDFAWPEHIWGDSRVQTNPTIEELWRSETASSRYLHSSPELFSLIGFPSFTH